MVVDDVERRKADLRARVRAARTARDADRRAADAEGLRAVALAHGLVRDRPVVAAYLSGPSEPGTGPLLDGLAATGTRVLLPVVSVGPPRDLDWAVDDGTTRPGPLAGLREPAGPRLGPQALATADVVLVPALAVDTLGGRLGQGGGFYDRALVRVRPGALVVAVVHDEELHDAAVDPVPVLAHDRRVDAVLTPTRCVAVRG
ncbi:5-formyltetrahydrofolate cyclo-ligase [Thalassiella azotivora]